jgi:hypothetical protein
MRRSHLRVAPTGFQEFTPSFTPEEVVINHFYRYINPNSRYHNQFVQVCPQVFNFFERYEYAVSPIENGYEDEGVFLGANINMLEELDEEEIVRCRALVATWA